MHINSVPCPNFHASQLVQVGRSSSHVLTFVAAMAPQVHMLRDEIKADLLALQEERFKIFQQSVAKVRQAFHMGLDLKMLG